MFLIVTGLPGSSKTSHVISKYKDVKDRPVYYRGINLTEEGKAQLCWTELTDSEATNWHKHIPDGALVIIDEAQELYPVRHASKPVPPGLAALETHRHHGWDVVFISQAPSLLDIHARTICNEHYHYERPFQMPYANQYHSGVGFVSPSNRSELTRCAVTRKKLPKEVWVLYKSAEVHTHKARPPLKVILMIVIPLIVAPLAFWSFFDGLSVGGNAAKENSEYEQPRPQNSDNFNLNPHQPETVQTFNINWSQAYKPDIPGLPFTAPIYRSQATKVNEVPVVHGCMSMKSNYSDCTCHTQQGTKIHDMPTQLCERILKHGMFNHMASRAESGRGAGEVRTSPRPDSPPEPATL